MTIEAQASTTPGTTTNAAGGTTAPGGQATAPPVPASPPAPPAAVEPPAPAAPVATAHVPTRKLVDDEGDIPDDADVLEFKKSTFKSRLDRHASATMTKKLQELGVDSIEAAKEKLARLEAYEKAQEEQRLAEMSEVDRLKTMHEQTQAELAEWRAKYDRMVESQQTAAVESTVMGVASKYVDPGYMEEANAAFQRHVNATPESAIGDDVIAFTENWFKEYVERKPAFKLQGPPPPPPAQTAPKPVNVIPMSNGAAQVNPTTPDGSVTPASDANKTAAPGQPNSMTDSEFRAYKKNLGYTF